MSKKRNWIGRKTKSDTEQRGILEDYLSYLSLPYGTSTNTVTPKVQMQLSAVYRCVEVISDACASLPIDVRRLTKNKGWTVDHMHDASYMLNVEPNLNMSRYTLIKTLVVKMLLDGNGYIIIRRDGKGNPIKLELVNDTVVVMQKDDGTIFYEVTYEDGKTQPEIIDSTDMIHVLNFSYNGLIGISTLTHANMSTSLSYASEKQAKGFFSGGSNFAGILQVRGKMDKEKATQLKTAWRDAFSTEDGTPNGIAVVEEGTDFTPVTVNPKDAQMLESRQYSVVEICRFFGVSPTKAFSENAASYNSVEAGQLAFLTDTIQPIATNIENEINRKLFRPSERPSLRVRFDTNELLRSDSDSQANYMMKMFQVGAYTSNEIREKIGNDLIPGGDVAYVQVNMQPLVATQEGIVDAKAEVVSDVLDKNKNKTEDDGKGN